MNVLRLRICDLALSVISLWKLGIIYAAWVVVTSSSAQASEFTIFDGTLYEEKPNLEQYSVKPVTILYVMQLWPDWHKSADRDDLPSKDHVQTLAREASETNHPVVIDIEHWPVNGDGAKFKENIEKYKTVLRWFKEAAPSVSVGLYGVLPSVDYWRAVKDPESAQYKDWVNENNRLMALVDYVDVIYPSIYTFYSNKSGWVKYAKAQVAEARKYGKPVVVFVWPQYHDSNKLLGSRTVPKDYWRLQLDTMKEYADGAVIWGGYKQSWDKSAGWWQETLDFLNDLTG